MPDTNIQVNRITQKAEAESVSTEAHVLITQQEDIAGVPTESLRRAHMGTFVDAVLAVTGLAIVDGKLCAVISRDE